MVYTKQTCISIKRSIIPGYICSINTKYTHKAHMDRWMDEQMKRQRNRWIYKRERKRKKERTREREKERDRKIER